MSDTTVRTAHLAAIEADTPVSIDATGGDVIRQCETNQVFAVLRDVADHDPVVAMAPGSVNTCAHCHVRSTASTAQPFPHLVSCPWLRAVRLVGRAVS